MTQITASYVDHMGNDLSVVRAAKVSFAGDPDLQWAWADDGHGEWVEDSEGYLVVKKWPKDPQGTVRNGSGQLRVLSDPHQRLIKYLAKHHHWTPFAHTSITFRVSAPVPIRTQCFKHKQGFAENEESRRYISSTPEVYVPEVWRKAPPEGGAKQGSSSEEVLVLKPDQWQMTTSPKTLYADVVAFCITSYEWMIASGVCPEQARLVLPQGCIVNWYWTGSLAAYARFYSQRTDPHAQLEIQDLARIIGAKLADLYPTSWKELTK